MASPSDRIVVGEFFVAAEEWGKDARRGIFHHLKLQAQHGALQIDVPLEHLADARRVRSARVVLEVTERYAPTDKERIAELERRVQELEEQRRLSVGDRVRIRWPATSWWGHSAKIEEFHVDAPRPYGLRIDDLPVYEGLKWYTQEELEKCP